MTIDHADQTDRADQGVQEGHAVTPSVATKPPRSAALRSSVLVRAARTRKGMAGLGLVSLIVGIAVFGPFFSPDDPTALGGLPFGGPNAQHLLGTDELGRDVLSRVLHGGLELIVIAAIAAALAVVVGGLLGLVAAYYGGVVDTVIMRICDVLLSFPQLIFVLLIVSILGFATWLLVLSVAVSQAPALIRVMRSAALEVREKDFVRAVQLWRPSGLKVILGEITPNVSGPFLVEAGLRLTYSIIVIAGVSFLGLGLQAPSPNWGLMISENRIGIAANPWSVAVPAALIAVLTVGVNMFTDAISSVILRGSGHHLILNAAFNIDTSVA